MVSPVRFTLPVFFMLFLSACQSDPDPRTLSVTKLDQLATVVAASKWIKNYCDRSDIPDQETLIRNALTQGKISNARADEQALTLAINQRYDAIDKDTLSRSQKCAALNTSLATFLQTIR